MGGVETEVGIMPKIKHCLFVKIKRIVMSLFSVSSLLAVAFILLIVILFSYKRIKFILSIYYLSFSNFREKPSVVCIFQATVGDLGVFLFLVLISGSL